MTTIVASVPQRLMAADTNIVVGEARFRASKIQRINGALVATSGDYDTGEIFIAWLSAGASLDDKKALKRLMSTDEEHDFGALVLTPEGELLHYCSPFPSSVSDPYFAIGSGAAAALASIATMQRLGVFVDVPLAVEMACEVDPNSRGPVEVLLLNNKPKRSR